MGLEILDGLSISLPWSIRHETDFESSFGLAYVFFEEVVALYHINEVLGVAVNVMSDKSGFACRMKCV